MDLGAPELLIVLAIVVLVFGVGRVSQLGGELGRALSEFRRGLHPEVLGDKEQREGSVEEPTALAEGKHP
jgi:sec-independent protein translocase protein TatA